MGGRRDGRRHQRTHGNGNGIGRGEHQRHERRRRSMRHATKWGDTTKRRKNRWPVPELSSIRSSAFPFEPASTPFPVAPSVIRSFSFSSLFSIVDTDEVRWTGTNGNERRDGSDSKRNGRRAHRLTVASVCCCIVEWRGACGDCSSASCVRIVCVVLILLAVAAFAVPWHQPPVPAATAWRPPVDRLPPSSSVLDPPPLRSHLPALLHPPVSSSACCSSSCSA